MKLISRDKAITHGLKRYYTGTQCKRGHTSDRYTTSRACCECDNERRHVSPHAAAVRRLQSATSRSIIVHLWNTKQPITMRQIGENLGITRNVVAKFLWQARKQGAYVLEIDAHEGARRAREARWGI